MFRIFITNISYPKVVAFNFKLFFQNISKLPLSLKLPLLLFFFFRKITLGSIIFGTLVRPLFHLSLFTSHSSQGRARVYQSISNTQHIIRPPITNRSTSPLPNPLSEMSKAHQLGFVSDAHKPTLVSTFIVMALGDRVLRSFVLFVFVLERSSWFSFVLFLLLLSSLFFSSVRFVLTDSLVHSLLLLLCFVVCTNVFSLHFSSSLSLMLPNWVKECGRAFVLLSVPKKCNKRFD